MVWVGPLQFIQPNPPAVSRDISNCSRLLRAPNHLAWSGSRDGHCLQKELQGGFSCEPDGSMGSSQDV